MDRTNFISLHLSIVCRFVTNLHYIIYEIWCMSIQYSRIKMIDRSKNNFYNAILYSTFFKKSTPQTISQRVILRSLAHYSLVHTRRSIQNMLG
jgi:hypothetical protein